MDTIRGTAWRGSRSSPTSTPTCRPSRRSWPPSSGPTWTRSTAAATWSATARTRTRSAGMIEQREIPTIYGNYDYAIARDLEDCGCAYRDQHDRELGQRSVAWTLEHTDPHSKDFMRGLPFDLRFELGGRRVRLVHGSPRKVNEYLFADKPARTVRADCGGRRLRRARLRPHPPALGGRVRRRPVRQLRIGGQAEGRRPARLLRPAGARPRARCGDDRAGGVRRARPSRVRWRSRACRRSTRRSW